jgi:hypothetical protein
MCFDAGAVDEQAVGHPLGPRQRAENVFPDAPLGPAHETVVERLLRTVDMLRAIAPASTALQGMNDAGKHTAIINPLRTAQAGRQQRLDPRPLAIGKPKEIRHSQRLLAGGLESHSARVGNPFIGSGP